LGFCYLLPESTLTLRSGNFGFRFLPESAGSEFEANLSVFQKAPLFTPCPPLVREADLAVLESRPGRVNLGRASLLGTANAAAIFFGFRQAIESWGKTKDRFHFKDDWRGDNLAQTDEWSHLIWGYKMTQFLFSAYRWAGFSAKAGHVISISQTAFILTMVEYPIDAYNPTQGFGVSDLVFDYAGIGLAWFKERNTWLEDFDVKISMKKNIFLSNQPMFAQTYEEFDNVVYWLTYRANLFLPQKIFCFGVGYSVIHHGEEPKRQFFGGIGLSLPDFASLFGKGLKTRVKFVDVFYANLNIRF
jgi:hypothetical protein